MGRSRASDPLPSDFACFNQISPMLGYQYSFILDFLKCGLNLISHVLSHLLSSHQSLAGFRLSFAALSFYSALAPSIFLFSFIVCCAHFMLSFVYLLLTPIDLLSLRLLCLRIIL